MIIYQINFVYNCTNLVVYFDYQFNKIIYGFSVYLLKDDGYYYNIQL